MLQSLQRYRTAFKLSDDGAKYASKKLYLQARSNILENGLFGKLALPEEFLAAERQRGKELLKNEILLDKDF